MKSILTFVALATLIASPALAAKKKSRLSSVEAYASAQSQQRTQRHSANSRNDVYVGGQYIGSDPDPMIRFQLQREEF